MAQPACKTVRDDLVACLLRTDCVIKSGKTPAECIRSPQELPLQCQHLITAYSDCKKGMLDMRRRFRGNHLSNPSDRKSAAVDAKLAAQEVAGDVDSAQGR
ncbi:hypothetical protein JCM24511_02542 [Saitozyma sp. JCM 24511]|nr:hypothetical protein JCM24511_02542 [Saitozyma sp. JCM 24511]